MYYDNMSRINNQFSVGVHIMTALGDHHGEQVTSAHLTASVRAHDSQVRSVLSKLVKAGLVVTSRGRNGFSSQSRPANKIRRDRKSTRLNSSHANISYAVF